MFNRNRLIIAARKSLGDDVREALLPAEAAAMQAAMQIATCSAALVERHVAAGLAPTVGAHGIKLVTEAVAHAHAARSLMLEAHATFAEEAATLAFLEEFVPTCDPNEGHAAARHAAATAHA